MDPTLYKSDLVTWVIIKLGVCLQKPFKLHSMWIQLLLITFIFHGNPMELKFEIKVCKSYRLYPLSATSLSCSIQEK